MLRTVFERGTDILGCIHASEIVTTLILESGGYIEGDFVDVTVPAILARTANRPAVSLQLSEVHRLLGTTLDPAGISADHVQQILNALGCSLTGQSDGAWSVSLPSWRLDLEREIDLIEEVARVYGYNGFANTLPAFAGAIRERSNVTSESLLRDTLSAAGCHEAISSTFASAAEAQLSAPQPGLVVPLENPLSEEAGVLRPSLIPGMLQMIAGNIHRDVPDVRLFELGTVFCGTTEKVDERPALAVGLSGKQPRTGPHQPARELDFFDLKGLVEQLAGRFKVRSIYFDSFPPEAGISPAWLHPYRAARLVADGTTAGWLGQLHPRLAGERKLKEAVYLAEIYLDRLYVIPLAKPSVREISRYQPVRRDFSLILPDSVDWAAVEASLSDVAASSVPELIEWRVRETYREGASQARTASALPADHYSLLLGTTFQAPDRTLREEELQSYSNRVVEAVSTLGGRLRS